MEIPEYAEYESAADFHLVDSTSEGVNGWVKDQDDLQRLLDVHSRNTLSQFISWHDDKKQRQKNLQRKFLWKHKSIPLESVPFVIDRHVILQCQYGKAHKRGSMTSSKKPVPDLHSYSRQSQKRVCIQTTRKVDCQAKIVIRYVRAFIQCKALGKTARDRKKIVDNIKERLINEDGFCGEDRIYVSLPTKSSHTNHMVSEFSGLSKRVHEKVKKKIYELVSAGITSVPIVKKMLKVFVDAEFSSSSIKPSALDRAYYPLSSDIKNHIHLALAAGRLADLDQGNVQKKIEIWKKQDSGRSFFIRCATVPEGGNEHDHQFLYVHQEQWQKNLLQRYGHELCLLDATYRTTKYSLPLFLLVVRTNVHYIPVAQFITEDETTESIMEALSILKKWNPDWKPSYMMVDYCESEIAAIENSFHDVHILLCAFHREQAWERWTKEGNKVGIWRNELLSKLREIAYAPTVSQFQSSLNSLTSCDWYNSNKDLKTYIQNKWLRVKERWCLAFMDPGFHTLVTTTNGVETLNKSLKHFYLKLSGTGSLSNLLEVIMKDFLPDLFQTYAMLNYKSSQNYKSYCSSIPSYLHNRPHQVVEHCMKRKSLSDQYTKEQCVSASDSCYLVGGKDTVYEVRLGGGKENPYCQCVDFRRHFLPCKHFFAVFSATGKSWDDLSEVYKDSPYLNLDDTVLNNSKVILPSATAEVTEAEEVDNDLDVDRLLNTNQSEQSGKPCQPLQILQRNLASDLKHLQNQAYICTDKDALISASNMVKKVACILSTNISKDAGLTVSGSSSSSSQLRMLPSKRKLKSKVFKRVGKKARTLHHSICTDLPLKENSKEYGIKKRKDKEKVEKKRVSFAEADRTGDSVEIVLTEEENTDDEHGKALQVLWSMAPDDTPVMSVGPYVLTRNSFKTLQTTLGDEIIDAYLVLLTKQSNTLHINCVVCTAIFEGAGGREVHDLLRNENVYDYDNCIGVVNEGGNHWTLVIIEPKEQNILYINPLGAQRRSEESILLHWYSFLYERHIQYVDSARTGKWHIRKVDHSKQLDGLSCGVYVLKFAEQYLKGGSLILGWNRSSILRERLRIGRRLLAECNRVPVATDVRDDDNMKGAHDDDLKDALDDDDMKDAHDDDDDDDMKDALDDDDMKDAHDDDDMKDALDDDDMKDAHDDDDMKDALDDDDMKDAHDDDDMKDALNDDDMKDAHDDDDMIHDHDNDGMKDAHVDADKKDAHDDDDDDMKDALDDDDVKDALDDDMKDALHDDDMKDAHDDDDDMKSRNNVEDDRSSKKGKVLDDFSYNLRQRKMKRKRSSFIYPSIKKSKRLYCKCQKPYDKMRFMVYCNQCLQWFHLDCIGLQMQDIPGKKEKFFCPDCQTTALKDQDSPNQSISQSKTSVTEDKKETKRGRRVSVRSNSANRQRQESSSPTKDPLSPELDGLRRTRRSKKTGSCASSSGRCSSSLSKRGSGGQNHPGTGTETSASHTRGTSKPHSSGLAMSGQEQSDNTGGQGGARPRTSTAEENSTPPIAGLSKEVCEMKIPKLMRRMKQIMICGDANCEEEDHQRHHEFLRNPIKVYNRERLVHCFGSAKFSAKVCEFLCMALHDKLVYLRTDPNRIYTGKRTFMIRNLPLDSCLQRTFLASSVGADQYVLYVLFKEMMIAIQCDVSGQPYSMVDQNFKSTETSVKMKSSKI